MSQHDDKLIPSNNISLTTTKLKPVGFGARVRAAQQSGDLASQLLDYSRYSNRIILCIDDSGSMSIRMSDPKLESNLHDDSRMSICRIACKEFIQVCSPHDTVLGLYTISTHQEFSLSTNYVHLLTQVDILKASGGTPTIDTLDKIQEKENVTRVIIVSDGESRAIHYGEFIPPAKKVLDKYKEKKCLIDTVFIGDPNSNGEREMKMIAKYTGGLFLVFKSGESFRTKFKYLAPAFRGMLTSGQVSTKD